MQRAAQLVPCATLGSLLKVLSRKSPAVRAHDLTDPTRTKIQFDVRQKKMKKNENELSEALSRTTCLVYFLTKISLNGRFAEYQKQSLTRLGKESRQSLGCRSEGFRADGCPSRVAEKLAAHQRRGAQRSLARRAGPRVENTCRTRTCKLFTAHIFGISISFFKMINQQDMVIQIRSISTESIKLKIL